MKRERPKPRTDVVSLKEQRHAQLRRAYLHELGGSDNLNEAQLSMLDRLCTLKILLDEQQTRYLSDDAKFSRHAFCQMLRDEVRLLTELGLTKPTKQEAKTLEDILAGIEGDGPRPGNGNGAA